MVNSCLEKATPTCVYKSNGLLQVYTLQASTPATMGSSSALFVSLALVAVATVVLAIPAPLSSEGTSLCVWVSVFAFLLSFVCQFV